MLYSNRLLQIQLFLIILNYLNVYRLSEYIVSVCARVVPVTHAQLGNRKFFLKPCQVPEQSCLIVAGLKWLFTLIGIGWIPLHRVWFLVISLKYVLVQKFKQAREANDRHPSLFVCMRMKIAVGKALCCEFYFL